MKTIAIITGILLLIFALFDFISVVYVVFFTDVFRDLFESDYIWTFLLTQFLQIFRFIIMSMGGVLLILKSKN